MENNFYTTKELAESMKRSVKYIRNIIYDNKIKPQATLGRTNLYHLDQFIKTKDTVIKYYPLKTTVTYEVYQSKINNQ